MASRLALIHSGLLNPSKPLRSLSLAFGLWKALVFLVVASCPGPGYDTSTGLLPHHSTTAADVSPGNSNHVSLSILLEFVRWDSIYFIHIVENGYVFEQEWAFGYGYTRLLFLLTTSVLPQLKGLDGVTRFALVAIALSHTTHYLSVLALYKLSINIFGHDLKGNLISFLSAALHIVCPAGAFLSAPYGESLFSFLNITGYYLYSSSLLDENAGRRAISHVKLLLAAIIFSIPTTVRSNGILSGALFAYDALLQLWRMSSQGVSGVTLIRLAAIVGGGCLVGLGFIVPQWIAYTEFCMEERSVRPWCGRPIPSIYVWVQAHYWNVGFLRYWTISNLPFFILAAPMLFVLCISSIWALNATKSPDTGTSMLTRLAVPHAILG
ncbi:GPI mannosyltransferase 2 [Aspergillus avenaceus]|uniref:GPI mannosyltransferase 2 n=1 Tax=Aspergillus avenaceus TaxID=36643 RepID=A0A5N6TR54_ASPAV|nr:GPI mannosyltransferase 2 [Aspergillus avenaceus]